MQAAMSPLFSSFVMAGQLVKELGGTKLAFTEVLVDNACMQRHQGCGEYFIKDFVYTFL